MTGLNFRHISFFFTNLAVSSTKHVQDGSDMLMQDKYKIPFLSSVSYSVSHAHTHKTRRQHT